GVFPLQVAARGDTGDAPTVVFQIERELILGALVDIAFGPEPRSDINPPDAIAARRRPGRECAAIGSKFALAGKGVFALPGRIARIVGGVVGIGKAVEPEADRLEAEIVR